MSLEGFPKDWGFPVIVLAQVARVDVMALASVLSEPLGNEDAATGLTAVDSDLAFILEKLSVEEDVRTKIGFIGYGKLEVFST